ncbi:DsbA family protein [Salidesulfovibrio onnuriiensis]|uniref:DsbA family protein n=1 Tax=Salidesulfovibrio onnuriiensis TaxID=2583823 RepID=UPI0011CB209F|nr:thioredoxin domain-containing protein [Salidesulfovibrio onnuriiensis]
MNRLLVPLILSIMVCAGCTAASSGNRNAAFEKQLRQTLEEHPEIVLEALSRNKVEMLTLVEQGAREREMLKREAAWKLEAANPLKPVVSGDRPVYGNRDAEITIVEYSDFLCPYCGRGKMTVKGLVDDSNGRLRVVFKHVPLHDGADILAAMFEAVGMQDQDKAWVYAEKVFERQAEFFRSGKDVINQVLAELDIDVQRAWKDAESKAVKERIAGDMAEAEKFGISGTPTYIVGGIKVRGALPRKYFERVLNILEEEQSVCEDCLN